MEVVEAESGPQAVEILKKEDNAFDLIITNYAPAGPQLLHHIFSQGLQVHFLLNTDKPPTGEFFEKQKSWIHFLNPNSMIVDINNHVKALFKDSIKDNRPKHLQFARIKTQILTLLNPLPGDLYVKLSDTKYLRMILKDDYFDAIDMDYFSKKKNMPALYIRAEAVVPFLAKFANIVYGKEIIVKPPPKKAEDRVRFLDKALETQDEAEINAMEIQAPDPNIDLAAKKKEIDEKQAALLKAKADLLKKKDELQKAAKVEKLSKEVAAELTQSLDSALAMGSKMGFNEEVQHMTKVNVLQTIAVVKKAPKLSEILDRIRAEKGKYISTHSMMLAHVACAFATKLDWTNDMTYQKLTLAAFLHDSPLQNHELAKLQTLRELEAASQKFTPEEMKAFKDHPITAAATARGFHEVPPDVDTIIAQHHERPDGTGFPRGLNHLRIAPLASVFIVAHDFVQFLIAKEKMGEITPALLDEFIRSHAVKYNQGGFRKVLAAARAIQG